jgi:hypothetical protein
MNPRVLDRVLSAIRDLVCRSINWPQFRAVRVIVLLEGGPLAARFTLTQ